MAYQQTTSSGGHLTKDYTIKEAGYAYLYISNEQTYQTDVYFDDVVMSYTPTNVIQSNEYYPFGLQAANSWTRDNTTNNFLYDAGNELNTTSGFYDLPYRNYDATLGRFFQIDPLAHRSHNLTAYHYAGNNPIGSNDPSGLMVPYYAPGQDPAEHLHDRNAQNSNMNDPDSWANNFGGPNGGSNSPYGNMHDGYTPLAFFVNEALHSPDGGAWKDGEGTLFNWTNSYLEEYTQILDNGVSVKTFNKVDFASQIEVVHGFRWALNFDAEAQAGEEWLFSLGEDLTALDPSTIGQNLLGLSYPGGSNPRSYNGQYNYSYVPRNKSEYPAIGHDRRYDNLGTAGASGLLTDTRAIGADWVFVAQEFGIALNITNSFEDRVDAQILGIGLGLAAMPKTIYQIIVNPIAIPIWFGVSNVGVTNTPSKH